MKLWIHKHIFGLLVVPLVLLSGCGTADTIEPMDSVIPAMGWDVTMDVSPSESPVATVEVITTPEATVEVTPETTVDPNALNFSQPLLDIQSQNPNDPGYANVIDLYDYTNDVFAVIKNCLNPDAFDILQITEAHLNWFIQQVNIQDSSIDTDDLIKQAYNDLGLTPTPATPTPTAPTVSTPAPAPSPAVTQAPKTTPKPSETTTAPKATEKPSSSKAQYDDKGYYQFKHNGEWQVISKQDMESVGLTLEQGLAFIEKGLSAFGSDNTEKNVTYTKTITDTTSHYIYNCPVTMAGGTFATWSYQMSAEDTVSGLEHTVTFNYFKLYTDAQIKTITENYKKYSGGYNDDRIPVMITQAQANGITYEGLTIGYILDGRYDFGPEQFFNDGE